MYENLDNFYISLGSSVMWIIWSQFLCEKGKEEYQDAIDLIQEKRGAESPKRSRIEVKIGKRGV